MFNGGLQRRGLFGLKSEWSSIITSKCLDECSEQLCVRLCASNFLLVSGYGNSTGSWDGYPHFVNADGLHLSPVICNENQSLLLHASYGFTPEMSYGQYSPVGTPLPSLLVEGPLCASQQVPFPPIYRPLPASPNVPAAVPVIPTELMTLESSRENVHYGTRSGYLIQYGSYGVGNISGIFGSSAVTSPAAYSQPVGILGSYEHRQQETYRNCIAIQLTEKYHEVVVIYS
ncbi:hypothetical protein SCA6_011099 [Theobroma cacao]